MNGDEALTYDFERDEWIASPSFVQARWIERELPRSAAEPSLGRWFGPPGRGTFPWRVFIRPFATVGAALCLLFLLGVAASAGALAVGAMGAVWGTLIALTMFGTGAWVLFRLFPAKEIEKGFDASRSDLRLLESPDDPDVCLVEITIFERGVAAGSDRGVAWFEGGRLLFSGHRTSFAIGGEDVLPRREWPTRLGDLALAGSLREDSLPLRHDYKAVYVRCTPLRHRYDWPRQAWRFTERFRVFRTRPPESRGPRQWPPFE